MNNLLEEPNKWISHNEVAEDSKYEAETETIKDLISTLHSSDISWNGHSEGPVKASEEGEKVSAPSIEDVVSSIAISDWDTMEQV